MITSKGHNDLGGKNKPAETDIKIDLGRVKIAKDRPNVILDFFKELMEIRKRKRQEEAAWLADYYNCFGFGDYDDWYDDEFYGRDWGARDVTDDVLPKRRNNSSGVIRSQRFVNGKEVDPDYDYDAFGNKTRKRHFHHRGQNKRKRYEGGTIDRTFQDGYDDDWFDNDNTGTEPDIVNDDRDVMDVDKLKSETKNIVFYRRLNNTADVYTFDNIFEFSEWLEEENIIITDYDAYETMYNKETHCCLDPQSTSKRLVCAPNYNDLVYYITGGDSDYLAEVSAQAPYI